MGAKPIKSELGGMERSESSDSDEGGPSVLIEEDKTYLSPRERTKRLTVNDFELLNVVGKGSFGKVLQVKKKDTGKIFAMKVLQKDVVIARNQLGHTMTERYILETIRHPFLISLRYAFQSAGKLYLVMDYAAGGELFFHLKKEQVFSEARAGFYGAEIILALKHLHDHGILYRDLKPENVLLGRDGHVLLTDFGLAKLHVDHTTVDDRDKRTHTFCGTPEYIAPEVLLNRARGNAIDWWSLGTLMYEMMVGIPPFYSENVQEMYQMILRSDLVFPPTMSSHACSLLSKLLERDPTRRLGSGPGGAKDVMNHPFFRYVKIDWDKLLRKQMKPEFVPKLKKGDLGAEYFDEEFTSLAPTDSVSPMCEIGKEEQDHFKGFSFSSSMMHTGRTPHP